MKIVLQSGMNKGGSLYGSQGDQAGSQTFVGIIRDIAKHGIQKNSIHSQITVIRQVIEMLKQYCGIEHLDVIGLMEMFRLRFTEYLSGRLVEKDKVPLLDTTLPSSLRMIPLYAPHSDNCLSWRVGNEITSRNLFISRDGVIVCVDYRQKLSGNMIEHPYAVSIFYAENDVLAECLKHHHLLFDYCMRNLIELAQGAAVRAMARAEAARKSVDKLVIIAEEMRARDLTVAILLSEEEPRGMDGSEMNRDIFRRLVEKAGSTPDARQFAFTAQLTLLGRKSLTEISHLPLFETEEIINTWRIG